MKDDKYSVDNVDDSEQEEEGWMSHPVLDLCVFPQQEREGHIPCINSG